MKKSICALICNVILIFTSGVQAAQPDAIFLLRHAEKSNNDSVNPELTTRGVYRANHIADILIDSGITAIYSTDFTRTQQTAKPLSDRLQLPVISYDPYDLEAFSKMLLQQSGVIVVVGHSNTTPELVKLLGGAPGSEIAETEFNRLYQLVFGGEGNIKTFLLRSLPN